MRKLPCAERHRGRADFPYLAGQQADYIIEQIKNWRTGQRGGDPLGLMKAVAAKLDDDDIAAVAAYYASLPAPSAPRRKLMNAIPFISSARIALFAAAVATATPIPLFAQTAPVKFLPPTEMPKGTFGEAVVYGEEVFDHTQTAAKAYVGNGLTCENCHIDSGRLANSAPMWAAFVAYPQYRSKTGKVDTIEDRIEDCFRYSMNGTPPPPDSKELTGLISYFYWLATGAPVGGKLQGALYPRLPKPQNRPRSGAWRSGLCQ